MVSEQHFRLSNLRVTVTAIEGRSVCGMHVGDYFDVTESCKVQIPVDRHSCLRRCVRSIQTTGWRRIAWSSALILMND